MKRVYVSGSFPVQEEHLLGFARVEQYLFVQDRRMDWYSKRDEAVLEMEMRI